MKGLLVKDLKLMVSQKQLLFIIGMAAVINLIFTDNMTFSFGFLAFVTPMFALSTISYDEYDNGNAFLFTLPITRTGYVVEKYCFGLLLGCASWIFAVLLGIPGILMKGDLSVAEFMMSSLLILSLVFFIQALMFPFQMKFGGEKGRIALLGVIGLIVILGRGILQGAKLLFHMDLLDGIDHLLVVSMGILGAVILFIVLIVFLISLKISAVIMNRKEF